MKKKILIVFIILLVLALAIFGMIKLLPGGKNSNSNNIKNDKVYIECDKDELNMNEEMTCNLK